MSRSGYTEDVENDWHLIKYRGQVASAMRGKRGQRFFRDLIDALDAMPEKRLIAGDLIVEEPPCDLVRWLFAVDEWSDHNYDPRRPDGWHGFSTAITWAPEPGVCAIGALGLARGVDMRRLDPEDAITVGETFDIAEQLAREVVWENDEGWHDTPEKRWQNMRAWAVSHLRPHPPGADER